MSSWLSAFPSVFFIFVDNESGGEPALDKSSWIDNHSLQPELSVQNLSEQP